MAKKRLPQILIVNADSSLGAAIQLLDDTLVTTKLVKSIIYKSSQVIDFVSTDKAVATIKTIKPDVVVNCNDLYNLRVSPNTEDTRSKFWQQRVVVADNVAKTCALLGTPLIHISSCDVFSRPVVTRSLTPFKETDVVNPYDFSGYSNVGAEHAVLRLAQNKKELEDRGFKYFVIRTGPVFGFIPGLVAAVSAINTLIDWSGHYGASNQGLLLSDDVVASPIASFDLAKFVMWLATNTDDYPSDIYHFANDGYPTAYEYGSFLSREVRNFRQAVRVKRTDIDNHDPKKKAKASTPLDCTKAADVFKYPVRSWEDSAAAYARICNKHM